MQQFKCDVCGVERTDKAGSGDWFTLGINDYGPPAKRNRKLHVYAWPLGCHSQQDDAVQHACSVTHMLELAKNWAQLGDR
jgi:hypothetical protein